MFSVVVMSYRSRYYNTFQNREVKLPLAFKVQPLNLFDWQSPLQLVSVL